ncbi:MAG: hypothetical protein K5851_07070 [Lachnospiraceae bacterium]|nr:hypothetical protein [Lachnospiraceae bacterium]
MNSNIFKKKVLSSALILSCSAMLFSSCGNSKRNSDTDYSKVDTSKIEKTYQINFINSESDDMKKEILLGYKDSLDALLGKDHYTINETKVDNESSASMAALSSKSNGYDLILANGKTALEGASSAQSSIPVVGTGILNFQTLLNTGNSGLLKPTGVNTTGTSTISPMDDCLSLIIESASDLKTVGLFYSPEDDDAIYQNEALESYMTNAGIPWKEYELASNKTATGENNSSDSSSAKTAIAPKSPTVYNSVYGIDTLFQTLDEKQQIESPSSPASARASQVSEDWTLPIDENAPNILNGSSNEDIIKYAASECSVIFIPGQANIKDQMDLIKQITTDAKVPTVSNGLEIGKKTLTSIYTDPYSFGYSAGKQTYRILIKGEKPENMDIESVSSSVSVKLYSKDIATSLGRSFPKSFHEYQSYIKETEPGATTKKITDE